MKRRTSNRVLRSLCGEVGPGDGQDPRLTRGESGGAGTGRKLKQLCSQVAEALQFALAETADDELIAGLTVQAVEPAPDATRLRVTVVAPQGDRVNPDELLGPLDRASARLRHEVARAITRRRTPTLSFRLSVSD